MDHRTLIGIAIAALLAVPAVAQQPTSKQVEDEARETMRRVRTGETISETEAGLSPCRILEAGVVAEVFGLEEEAISYRAGSTRHPVCTASWRKPDADEIEAGQSEKIMDWMRRRTAAQSKGEPFSEPMPIARADASASLTLVDETFESAEAAVRQLESTVATLEEGITVEVGGRKHTSQVDYDDWMEGVGDRAAWAPKLSQLSVAARGVVFHVGVEVTDDAAVNRERAIELARRIAAGL